MMSTTDQGSSFVSMIRVAQCDMCVVMSNDVERPDLLIFKVSICRKMIKTKPREPKALCFVCKGTMPRCVEMRQNLFAC